jgi:7,8-dihydropterin-6-yl-methyl-4-(beta-D-ribofuranosyl)aminobenzene 5'-phosphate synthase
MKITILYDNEAEKGFKSGWGFSCLVEHDGSIDIIVLSHNHRDHIGGLSQVIHPEVDVYLPGSFSKRLKNEISKKATVHEVSGPLKIMEGVHLTGELGSDIKEQSMAVETGSGLLVITGCAHPGLDVIMEAAGKLGRVTGILGGFHGFDRLERLDDLDLIIPCHCTDRKKEIIERFPDKVRTCAAGTTFHLNRNYDDPEERC